MPVLLTNQRNIKEGKPNSKETVFIFDTQRKNAVFESRLIVSLK